VTAKWVKALAAQKKLTLPIIEGVYRILNREADPLTELGTMLDLIITRSRSGRRWRGPSELLRGTAEWAKGHLPSARKH
jgi:glycerol-3-phosphate dehydrogenase